MVDHRVALGPALWLWITLAWGCGDSTHPLGARCMEGEGCLEDELCNWEPQHACGRDHAEGTCVMRATGFCPDLAFLVCGCDGVTYSNQCHTDSRGVAVDYGGPCRPAGVFVACTSSADCPMDDEVCVDDPRNTCAPGGNASCPGVCVHAASSCSPDLTCLPMNARSVSESPGTQACVAVAGCTGLDCDSRCVYTTRATCKAAADCGSGELCLPVVCSPRESPCPPSVCVRP
jgi:hypothetical protein